MGNLGQQLKDLILTKQDISDMQVPLAELCMVSHGDQSYGPIWTNDLSDIKAELAPVMADMRWRKFGTDKWAPMQELLGAVDLEFDNDNDNETDIGIDITMLDDHETLAPEQTQDETENATEDEEIHLDEAAQLKDTHRQALSNLVLPPPPSREQFAWGREAVAKKLEQESADRQQMEDAAVAELINVLKSGQQANAAYRNEKQIEKNREKEEDSAAETLRQATQAITHPSNTAIKISISAVAGVLLLLGLRLGIERLPTTFFSLPNLGQDGGLASDNKGNDNADTSPVNGTLALPKGGRAPAGRPGSTRAPASSNRNINVQKRKENAMQRRNSFRDSGAYQRQETGPEGVGFNDVDRMTEADYNVDDGSAPVEQDPLRRKLGRDTVNPDPAAEEDRAPASEEQPEAMESPEEVPPSEE